MSLLIIIFLIFGLVWAFMGGYFIYNILRYKHDFIMKKPQGNSFVAYRTKAMEFKDKNGVDYWKLKKKLFSSVIPKAPIPVPPNGALAINNKGKFYVEAWLLEDGQIQYESHPKPVAVDISTTNQKVLLANHIAKAESERYKSWKNIIGEKIIPLGAIFILGLVIVMGMIFWQDITAPGLQAKQISLEEHKLLNDNLVLLREIKFNIQSIGVKPASYDNLTQKPPN